MIESGRGDGGAPALHPIEVACGVPFGLDDVPKLNRSHTPVSPLVAIEEVLEQALRRPPCLVGFSGGRDSSALLAVAARVARSRGLDLPIPATLVFPDSEESDESEWQSPLLRHLDLTEWIRIEIHDELDAVGPVAGDVLNRHGLLWPFNTHFHVPIIELAAGGTVVTGFGGDELGNSTAFARAERLLADRRVWKRDQLLVIGLAASPALVRSAVYRHRPLTGLGELPWLTPEGTNQAVRAYGDHQGSLPLGWERKLRRWIWPGRLFRVTQASFRVLGATHDVEVVHPFIDGRVLDALGQCGGFRGLGSRSDLMRAVFGDLLPSNVIERRTKGAYTDPLWTGRAKRFAEEWSGEGVDRSLIDANLLRRHWTGQHVNLLSTTLLQSAWLHDNGR